MTILAGILLFIVFLGIMWCIMRNRKHRPLGGCSMMPIPYDPDVHGEDMDPGMISAAVAFQTGEIVCLNQSGPNEWTLQSSNIKAVGKSPAATYKKFMEKYYEDKTGIRK